MYIYTSDSELVQKRHSKLNKTFFGDKVDYYALGSGPEVLNLID